MLMVQSNCSRCLAPLQPDDKLCPQCHALVHAADLEALRSKALEYEGQGQVAAARQLWTAAHQLVPSESKQAQWIEEHLRLLDQRLQAGSGPPADAPPQAKPEHPWAKRLGPLAPLAILLAKAKTVLFALFKLKFLFSFAAFLGIYWALFGAWFGVGFAVMILIHEMGHFAEVKRRGLPADMPVFLPGVGAYVKWQALGVSSEVRALISLAGPAAGFLAALVAAALYWETHNPLWAALAHTGAWLNLLNLIPVWMLDGASAIKPLSAAGRVGLLAVSALLFWWSGQAVLLLLAAGFAWQLFRKRFPAEGAISVQLYYVAVVVALAWVLHAMPASQL
jgi:Zn-dependent protease